LFIEIYLVKKFEDILVCHFSKGVLAFGLLNLQKFKDWNLGKLAKENICGHIKSLMLYAVIVQFK
jgi:hypothetical protein